MNGDNIEQDQRLARLYEAAGSDAPAPELDAAILAAARRSVHAGPRAGGGGDAAPVVRQKRNWYVPMSIAAVLVLSVSVVTLVQEEKGGELAQPPMPRASVPAKPKLIEPAAPAPSPPPAAVLARPAPAAATESGAARNERPSEELSDRMARAPALSESARESEARKATAAAGPAAPVQDGLTTQRQGDDQARERRAAPTPTPFPAVRESAPAETTASRDQSRSAADYGAGSGAALGGTRPDSASRAEAKRDTAAKQAASPPADARIEERAPGSAAATAPATRSVPLEAQSSAAPPTAEGRVQAEPPVMAAAKPAVAPPPPAKAMVRAAPKPALSQRPAWLAELEHQPPERWLERLAQYRRDGRNAEADELLAEFRKRFPDHPANAR